MSDTLNIRIGQGFDVHAFGDGDHVMLGGVRIAHEHGLKAHSDGDVVIHALCDAMLGALALGDIGQHFPPDDPQWKDSDSRAFLRHCKQSHAAATVPWHSRLAWLDLCLSVVKDGSVALLTTKVFSKAASRRQALLDQRRLFTVHRSVVIGHIERRGARTERG